MNYDSLYSAWISYRDDHRQFRTTLGRPEIAVIYSTVSHPIMIRVCETYFLDGEKFPRFAVKRVQQNCFGKDFFKHLKGSETNMYAPPLLLDFNCIHCPASSFNLRRNLGNTKKKFCRFTNPINSHEYLASNLCTCMEIMEFMDFDLGGSKFYSQDEATPIPTFRAFLEVLRFLRRFK